MNLHFSRRCSDIFTVHLKVLQFSAKILFLTKNIKFFGGAKTYFYTCKGLIINNK
jgi:hypothetical protein